MLRGDCVSNLESVWQKKGDFKGACPLRREGRAQRSATAGGDFPLPVYFPNKSE